MPKSTPSISTLRDTLTGEARRLGLTDAGWAARAGVRKETLSRLRRRQTCDFATLSALAKAVGAELGVVAAAIPEVTPDGHFPLEAGREYEERLVELCRSRVLEVSRWKALGPAFFMAGLAVMLASEPGFDRRGLLALAESMHPGASEPAVFSRWLERSPMRPSRFLPLLHAGTRHAA